MNFCGYVRKIFLKRIDKMNDYTEYFNRLREIRLCYVKAEDKDEIICELIEMLEEFMVDLQNNMEG